MIFTDKDLLKGYSFIDLFAGIGGFHLALNSMGAKCVFASEWDKYAVQTYEDNFNLKPFGDITKIKEHSIPQHDILCGGFPCQSFSISGKQKGFDDTRGTLFFDIVRIANFRRPKVLFLENVKNLIKHDNGKTLTTIIHSLKLMDYSVYSRVLNSSHYGLPQNRERIYIIAFQNSMDSSLFQFPQPIDEQVCIKNILEKDPKQAKIIEREDIELVKQSRTVPTLFNDNHLVNKPIQIGKVNKGGQGERIYDILGHSITLSAYGGGVGAKTGLYLIDGKIRKLSPRECARLQGFPDEYRIHPIVSQAYKQFGNSVSVNVLQYILLEIAKVLEYNNSTKQRLDLQYA